MLLLVLLLLLFVDVVIIIFHVTMTQSNERKDETFDYKMENVRIEKKEKKKPFDIGVENWIFTYYDCDVCCWLLTGDYRNL